MILYFSGLSLFSSNTNPSSKWFSGSVSKSREGIFMSCGSFCLKIVKLTLHGWISSRNDFIFLELFSPLLKGLRAIWMFFFRLSVPKHGVPKAFFCASLASKAKTRDWCLDSSKTAENHLSRFLCSNGVTNHQCSVDSLSKKEIADAQYSVVFPATKFRNPKIDVWIGSHCSYIWYIFLFLCSKWIAAVRWLVASPLLFLSGYKDNDLRPMVFCVSNEVLYSPCPG